MTARVHCDGCGEHLMHKDFIGAKGWRLVTRRSGRVIDPEEMDFDLCHPCTKKAFDSLGS